ncbi:MAG: PH domain-containing protein [Cyclobacteriaceae bacterium]|nr:PH domain-containing protein [Cyclobacteriaceae bacterium]
MEEKLIWKGHPSQWINFGTYVLCFLFCWLIIPIFIAIWKYLLVRTWTIEITDQRIIEGKGIFSKTTDELELFRVKDLRLEEPFLLRLVGLSNILMNTSDRTHPVYLIPAVRNGGSVREELRVAIDARREKKQVRETDFE